MLREQELLKKTADELEKGEIYRNQLYQQIDDLKSRLSQAKTNGSLGRIQNASNITTPERKADKEDILELISEQIIADNTQMAIESKNIENKLAYLGQIDQSLQNARESFQLNQQAVQNDDEFQTICDEYLELLIQTYCQMMEQLIYAKTEEDKDDED